MKRILVGIVKGYKLLASPLLPPACRYYPTCSQYAIEAMEKHGAAKGAFLTMFRLLRCAPYSKGGFDPVP